MRAFFLRLLLLVAAGSPLWAERPMKWESLMLLKAAAEKGDADAQFLMGLQYKVGDGVAKDLDEAGRLLRRAAESGHVEAQVALGILQAEGGDPAGAVTWLRLAAEKGNADAMLNLGALYAEKGGATADAAEAVSWYQKAAEAGQAGACRALAEIHAQGKGVARDPTQAIHWYRRAAELGDTDSRFVLGRIEAVTTAVTDDPEKALAWWRREAEKGDIGAALALELIAARSRSMEEDPAVTARWSVLLSGLRGADAHVVRGFMLENGVAMNRDLAAAAAAYRKAAELGHPQGEYRLGLMYAEGRGVPLDRDEARRWLDLAAAQGVQSGPEKPRAGEKPAESEPARKP